MTEKSFRMNWYDFLNHQIKYNGVIYQLIKRPIIGRNTRTRIMFLLNVHRGEFVSCNDIIDFVYAEMDVDKWPDGELNSIRATISKLKLLLPCGVIITNSHSFGYKLEIEGECND